jgi:hypothetical protein
MIKMIRKELKYNEIYQRRKVEKNERQKALMMGKPFIKKRHRWWGIKLLFRKTARKRKEEHKLMTEEEQLKAMVKRYNLFDIEKVL